MATQEQCQQALDNCQDQIMSLTNVVGIGILPYEPEATGSKPISCCVAVYVSKKLPLEQLDVQDVVPRFLNVVTHGKRTTVPTQVIEQGIVELE